MSRRSEPISKDQAEVYQVLSKEIGRLILTIVSAVVFLAFAAALIFDPERWLIYAAADGIFGIALVKAWGYYFDK